MTHTQHEVKRFSGAVKVAFTAASVVVGIIGVAGTREDAQRWAAALGIPLSDVGALAIAITAIIAMVLLWLPRPSSSQPDRPHRTGVSSDNSRVILRDVRFKNMDQSIDAKDSDIRAKNVDIE